jgi:1-acyl-sn-glycerol-3-phosphate acyltransferase
VRGTSGLGRFAALRREVYTGLPRPFPVGSRTLAAVTDRQRVAAVVAEVLGRTFEPGERLNADSLSQAELILALEDAFSVRLPDDLSLTSVEDATAHVSTVSAGGVRSDPLGRRFGHLQRVAMGALGPVLERAYRLDVRGAERVPPSGPAVLASNHDSLLDIPFLVVSTSRPVWFMAKVELFKGPVSSWFFHVLGGFPVRRGGYDLRAVRSALEVIRRGLLLGMYPEGTRAPYLQSFLPGAAWMALATGAPLVPVGVTGTAEAMPKGSSIPRRTQVTVSLGEPMRPGREEHPRARLERAREITDDLRVEVEKLLASSPG